MNFRTELNIPAAPFKVDHDSKIFAVGSCFAANMAARLHRAKFIITDNPFGEMFNPVSIAGCIERLSAGKEFVADDFRSGAGGGLWFSWMLHGSFDSASLPAAVTKANEALRRGSKALLGSDTVIMTLGTAWVYTLDGSNMVAANCHKQPQTMFRRRRLSVGECIETLRPLFDGVLKHKRIILTVSPVRHMGDGLTENSLSKSTLRVAAAELESACPNVWYFPAYELLMDDLRDYRFYADDMVHPSVRAIDYVWEKFCASTMTPETLRVLGRFERLADATAHRPLHPDSAEWNKFRQIMLREIETLRREFPQLEFGSETDCFSK